MQAFHQLTNQPKTKKKKKKKKPYYIAEHSKMKTNTKGKTKTIARNH